MRIKKLTRALLIISSFLFIVFGVSACSLLHTHVFTETVTMVEATCTSNGLQKKVCFCGHVEYNQIGKIEHTPVVDPAEESTCTNNGKTEGSHCGVCNTVIVPQTNTEKAAHTFSAWEIEAEATCTSHGLQKRTCDCGHTEYASIEKVAHTPVVDAAVEATCTNNGKTEGSHCGVCNAVIVPQISTEKVAHTFSAWEIETEATCTSHGLQKRVCDCGYAEYNSIEKVAHTPVVDAAIEATCTNNGKTEGSHCGVCNAVIVPQITIEKVAHAFSTWKIVAKANCTSHGLQKRVCDCGYTEYNTIPMVPHAPIIDPAVEATCTTNGKTEGSHCLTCDRVLVAQNIIFATGHEYAQPTILQEATCNQEGEKRYSCINEGCEYYYDESYCLEESSPDAIYEEAISYTGTLITFNQHGHKNSEGLAFIISADGKILTSNLLMDNAYSALFKLGNVYYDVTEVLAYSTRNNLIVLKIDATDLPFANVCTNDPVVGETVYTVGAPSGYKDSISSGIISNAQRIIAGAYYIQHDADMMKGYIGGPLLNRFGEVIGVNVGYIGDDKLNLSAAAKELNNLNYDNPMTLEEYGNLTYTPDEKLAFWIQNFYTHSTETTISHGVEGSTFRYSLGYNFVDNYSYVDGFMLLASGQEVYVRVFLNDNKGVYQYYATIMDGSYKNEVYGFFDAATYNESTLLTYDSYYGKYWSESQLMGVYTSAVYRTLGWFSYCLDVYFADLTLETFGFTSLSYDYNENALDWLNAFVQIIGNYNQNTGAYEYSMSSQANGVMMIFTVAYTPQNGEMASTTVLTISAYTPNDALYRISITLNPTESGNRFDALYAVFNGQSYSIRSMAWGYIEADTFTDTSALSSYEFVGMEDYEDAILSDYAYFTSYLLDWANMLMMNVDASLSIKDLGFLFYFG